MDSENIKAGVFRLSNAGGMQVDITNYGARIMRMAVDGIDIVQGFDRVEDYFPENHESDFGAVIGRYANRLAGGRICVDGETIQLPQNNGPNCLHGGPMGWQYSLYEVVEAASDRLVLAMVSPDGDNGFPGRVRVRVTYTLGADNTLGIAYRAETDRATVINMTNHSYFNLNGDLSSSIHNHTLCIDADRYTPIDEVSIPLGEHATVDGTPFDFRSPKAVGRDIDSLDPQLLIGRGYDHNFVLNHPVLDHASVVLKSPITGIGLQVMTDAPGVQVYTGNFLGGVVGKGGEAYPVRSAICLETQQYPDSPNHRWPESTGRLYPDKPFESTTIFKITRQ
jgi:aldose 1-epimerase